MKISKNIDAKSFFREFEAYTQKVKESLFQNQTQRDLDQKSRRIYLLKKLISLKLTRTEWEELKGQKAPGLETWYLFYENAEQRDQAMFDNLLPLTSAKQLADRRTASRPLPEGEGRGEGVLLITGGFHTKGLTERLKLNGISYAVIIPKLENIPSAEHYQSNMKGNVSWKSYFKVKNGRVSLYDAFVRAVRDQLIQRGQTHGSDPFMLKTWRDQIIRDLVQKEKTTQAFEYTKYLDEVADKNHTNEFQQKWQANIEKFLSGLRDLNTKNQLTETNVLKPPQNFQHSRPHDF